MELRDRVTGDDVHVTGRELVVAETSVIVGGDVSLAAVDAALVRARRWLPADGPSDGDVGLLISRDSAGPLSAAFGGWANLVRQAWVEAPGGKVCTLTAAESRLIVGARGSLGRVIKVELSTVPRPAACLAARVESGRDLSALKPSWCVAGRSAVWAGWLGSEADIARADGELTNKVQVIRHALLEDEALRLRLWQWPDVQRVERLKLHFRPGGLRALVLEARLLEWVAEPMSGIMLLSFPPSEIRALSRLVRVHGGWLERLEKTIDLAEVEGRWGIERVPVFTELRRKLGYGRLGPEDH